MKWQPIDTAPTGLRVALGKWQFLVRGPYWYEQEGIAWESAWFGLSRKRTYEGEYFTHWKPLPPPPS